MREGEFRYACAIRHENVTRCPINNAFGFYCFSLLQNNAELVLDERFCHFMVVRGRKSGEESLCATRNWVVCKKICLEHGIETSKVTHGGRHSGSFEAHIIGVSTET
ncbi:hypothetical protein MBANPS3_012416 [Mucor bainieri]